MAIRVSWNIYEAVILLNACEHVLANKVSKNIAVKTVSGTLRQIAVNNGLMIDDVFRNENGISMQMTIMTSIIQKKKSGLHKPARVFYEAVELYNKDRISYNKVLKEALNMAQSKLFSIDHVQKIEDVYLSHPNQLLIFSQEYKVNTWSNLFVIFLSVVNSKFPDFLDNFYKNQSTVKRRLAKSENIKMLNRPVQIPGSIYYVETSIKALGLLRAISKFCSDLHIDTSTVFVYYDGKIKIRNQDNQNLERSNSKTKINFEQKLQLVSDELTINNSTLSVGENGSGVKSKQSMHQCQKSISIIMKSYYNYGFRIDSVIDLKRFRRYAENDNIVLPEADDVLKSEIKNLCVVLDEKVYYFDDEVISFIKETIKCLKDSNYTVLFFDCVYENNRFEMEKNFITSPELLKSLLKQRSFVIFDNNKNIFFGKNFISFNGNQTEKEAVVYEIKRVWGNVKLKSVDELEKLLTEIPRDHIKRYLSFDNQFVWTSEGTYFFIDRLSFDDSDITCIIDFVAKEYAEKGFVTLNSIPIDNIEIENFEVPKNSIYNAVYNKFLINNYKLNGKVLTKYEDKINVSTLAKEYLADKSECSFTELNDFVTELSGGTYRYVTYDLLYTSMIRVSEDRFVALKCVEFDVTAIDLLLSEIIKDGFIAIKEVTSFAIFPTCGYPWTHYLLESYCYLFSKKYCLKVIGFNDKNAGIIAEKNIDLEYNDMLALAASRAKINLTPKEVGRFFFETGYMGKRKFQMLDDIVAKAKTLREE